MVVRGVVEEVGMGEEEEEEDVLPHHHHHHHHLLLLLFLPLRKTQKNNRFDLIFSVLFCSFVSRLSFILFIFSGPES